jgi:uncharacterized membrane protein
MITTFFAIFLLLLLPGYSLVSALYPKKDDLNYIQRASLSFGFPLTVLAFGILIKNINPIAISLPFILLLIATFTLVFIVVAYIRRQRVPEIKKLQKDFRTYENLHEDENQGETGYTEANSEVVNIESDNNKISHRKFVSKDLLIIFLTALIIIIVILSPKLNDTLIRTILEFLLILFVTGYSLLAALFPKIDDLDSLERVGLSFGLSIVISPATSFLTTYIPVGIEFMPLLVTLSIFTIIMVFIGYIRRRRVPEGEKFYVNFGGFFDSIKNIFNGKSRKTKMLTVILVLSVIIAIAATSYIIVKPKQGETFTEFYLLGPNGQASDYPTNITVGQNASVIIGIVNHEYNNVDYNLVVTSDGVVIKDENITLKDGSQIEIPYNFTESSTGIKNVVFVLYKLPDNTTVYRSLHLFVNVK